MTLLTVDDLRTYFHTRNGVVRAVDGVSFDIASGETVGIVGESGSGKSVTAYSLLGLLPMPPGRIESGTARFDDVDLLHCSKRQLRTIRGGRIAMIFQDPMTSLNPFMKIGTQVVEPLRIHMGMTHRAAAGKAVEALEAVGIRDAASSLDAYPHQFSGGMRQRVTIAMALCTKPALLIADEPTTALDVTVQAQILALIKKLQQDTGTAMMLITHDMGIVAGTCDRVLVMYAGRIVESGPTRALFYRPRHPYTEALLASLPASQETSGSLRTIPGLPPDLTEPILGCPFAPRCAKATEICRQDRPELVEVAPAQSSACVRVQRGEI